MKKLLFLLNFLLLVPSLGFAGIQPGIEDMDDSIEFFAEKQEYPFKDKRKNQGIRFDPNAPDVPGRYY